MYRAFRKPPDIITSTHQLATPIRIDMDGKTKNEKKKTNCFASVGVQISLVWRLRLLGTTEDKVFIVTCMTYRKSKHEVILQVFFFCCSVVCIFFHIHPFRLKNVTCFIAVRRHRCHGLLRNWIPVCAEQRDWWERIIKIYTGEKAHYVLAINRKFADGFYGRQHSRAFDPEG